MKILVFFLIIFFVFTARAQNLQRDFDFKAGGVVDVTNLYGRVDVSAEGTGEEKTDSKIAEKISVSASSSKQIAESEIKIDNSGGRVKIEVAPADAKTRVDLIIKIPPRARVKIKTAAGEASVAGNVESAEIETETGTIAANVPLENLKYDFVWTESRPRFLSDVELEEVKEKAAGKFVLTGRIGEKSKKKKTDAKAAESDNMEQNETAEKSEETADKKDEKKKSKEEKTTEKTAKKLTDKSVKLNFKTARGIVLLNVNPNEVPSDLRERPLTEAAKAIIRSGDSLLMEAIRRASPKYFGEYAKTLPPRKTLPSLSEKRDENLNPQANVKKVLVRVSDINNRAIADLRKSDFLVTENGEEREILSVEPTTASFNLVLLLDVSGSVDAYVDFIRKAARNFVNTVSPNDRIAIIIFNEDVKTLSTFTTDKGRLSESLDTFDAGGGTAYYDAIAYTLAETLRPLKGERTAVVVLSDGDDNRSFLPFDSLLGSIQESGALIYPLYVPSGLIAASAANNYTASIDPLRTKFMGLTSKAETEGEKLAQVSGGVYYPIKQLSELQKAYDDIVLQLRTAYTVTFRSNVAETKGSRASPRLRIKVKRENAFVKIGSVVEVPDNKTSELKKNNFLPRPQTAQSEEQFDQINLKLNFNNSNLNNLSFVQPGFGLNKKISFAVIAPLRQNVFQKISFSPASFQANEIVGEIEKINYKQFANDNLRETKLENFDINKSSGAFILDNGKEKIAVSRWISPKRTRSYPYERVYDTLAFAGKKVTVIPVVKDEGLGGERDFLQWDTVSLLSLLDVHVVLAYYGEAEKNPRRNDQITAQKFDNNYISARLNEVFNFKGTAREWNERETKGLKSVFEEAKFAYREISKNTKTYLHDEAPLNELIKLAENPNRFAEFSRRKAQKGQSRELESIQPKEALSTDTKSGVTITNLGGGKYFFTCDETRVENRTLYLIEGKHSPRTVLPGENDIKDGLLKMMVYTNLQNARVGKTPVKLKSVLRLTSSKLVGSISSENKEEENAAKFFQANSLNVLQTNLVKKLFREAQENDFTIILEKAETAK